MKPETRNQRPVRTPPRPSVYTPAEALQYVWSSFNRLKTFWNLQIPEAMIDNEIGILDGRIKNLKLSLEHETNLLIFDALRMIRDELADELKNKN